MITILILLVAGFFLSFIGFALIGNIIKSGDNEYFCLIGLKIGIIGLSLIFISGFQYAKLN